MTDEQGHVQKSLEKLLVIVTSLANKKNMKTFLQGCVKESHDLPQYIGTTN